MSRQPPAALLPAVERAADLRAAGTTWKVVADSLGESVDTVRGWTHEYPEFWAARLAAAHAEQDSEVIGEARTHLRRQMRSEEPKEKDEAIRLVIALVSRRRPGEVAEPAPLEPEYRRIADHLRGLTDEQLRACVEDQLRCLTGEGPPALEG